MDGMSTVALALFLTKVAWLIGTGLLTSLFRAGAVSSMLHPKYAIDPILGSAFLAAGLPVLGLIG